MKDCTSTHYKQALEIVKLICYDRIIMCVPLSLCILVNIYIFTQKTQYNTEVEYIYRI